MAAKKTERKKRQPAAPEGETKRAKFTRLATARVNKAVKTVSLIGNLAGPGYEFTSTDLDTIRNALDAARAAVIQRFEAALQSPSQVTSAPVTFA